MAQAFAPLRWLAARRRGRAGSDLDPRILVAAGADVSAEAPAGASPGAALPGPVLVDAATRTFWRRGAASSETLIEAGVTLPASTVGHKVAELAAAQRPAADPRRAPGPGDPAFVEMTLVEMLRAGRFDRAFALLAPDCRTAWGSVDTFAMENVSAARHLLGAEVQASRRVASWEDAEGRVHRGVAELEVDYALAGAERIATLRRTVHLVRAEGGWRSLVYPTVGSATAAQG
ncbi:MAG TPA: hypothetical protein VI316_11155 [Candidatus Dormibacteraeota bacterium]